MQREGSDFQMILWTIDCPKCKILEKELKDNNIAFDICKDKQIMVGRGWTHLPILEVDHDTFLNFKEAMKWIEENAEKVNDNV